MFYLTSIVEGVLNRYEGFLKQIAAKDIIDDSAIDFVFNNLR